MRVILCYPPQKEYRGFGQGKRWLPLGIASIGAYLKEIYPDLDIVLLDLFHYSMPDAIKEVKDHLDADCINLVGFTCMTEQRFSVWQLASAIKEDNVINIVGGPHAFLMAEQIKESYPFIDIVVKGEGEVVWQNIIETYKNESIIEAKIWQCDNVKDLNMLPYAINGFRLFKNVPNEIEAEAPIIMSRGCTDCCTFCSTTAFWRGYRARSSLCVFEEMKAYEKEYGTKKFKFHDDASTADIEEWKMLCELIIKHNGGWSFEITARADHFNDDLIMLLKEAGCHTIAVGIESGSETIRNAMNKKLNIDLAKENMKKIKEAGINLVFLMIVAYPGENDETIEETYQFVKEVNPTKANFMPLMILPGTKVYRDCVKWGWIDDSYWLQDRPQPYYTREQTPETIDKWVKYLNTYNVPKRILLCAPVHEDEKIFKLYLEHLRRLEIPEGYEVHRGFMLHNCEHLSRHLKKEYNEVGLIYNNTTKYEKNENTHLWKNDNFSDVVKMKNNFIDIMLKNNFDYIFYVDSDLMLHPKTLVSLLKADKDMIAEIFWTEWQKEATMPMVEMPNCWISDHYNIDLPSLNAWKNKGYYRVGMTGACTLIKRKVLESGIVNWNPIYNQSFSIWEDRAFCTRVAVEGHEIWIDTHYPAKHLYRESEYNKFIKGGGKYE